MIRVHRGDRLHMTFSSLDTGHSFFLEEFDIDAKFSPGSTRVERFRVSDPTAPVEVTDTVVFEARHPGLGAIVGLPVVALLGLVGPL